MSKIRGSIYLSIKEIANLFTLNIKPGDQLYINYGDRMVNRFLYVTKRRIVYKSGQKVSKDLIKIIKLRYVEKEIKVKKYEEHPNKTKT